MHCAGTGATAVPGRWVCGSDVQCGLKYQSELPTFFKLVLNRYESLVLVTN